MNIGIVLILFTCLSWQINSFLLPMEKSEEMRETEKDILEVAQGAADVLKSVVELMEGIERFKDKLPEELGAIIGVIGAAASLISLFSDDDNEAPSETELKVDAIIKQVDVISEEMDKGFKDMAALLVGNSFITDIVVKVEVLEDSMKNHKSQPSRAAKKQFLATIESHNPLSILMDMKYRLRYYDTNPLVHAMAADKTKSKKMFEYWENWIYFVIFRVTMIQSYYSGVKYPNKRDRNTFNIGLQETIQTTIAEIQDFLNNYEAPYWPQVVQDAVHMAQNKCASLKEEDRIKQTGFNILIELNKTVIADALYIIVYHPLSGYDRHMSTGDATNEFRSFDRNGTNVIVYRSANEPNETKIADRNTRIMGDTIYNWKTNKILSDAKEDDGQPGLKVSFDQMTKEMEGAARFLTILGTTDSDVRVIGNKAKQGKYEHTVGSFIRDKHSGDKETIPCTIVACY